MQTPTNDQQIKPHNKQKCPRCDSLNTKFCYYNNYSLSQPRYFCKSCRRYWTHGGTLRNVPVGGGSRKTKRPKTIPAVPPTLNVPPSVSAVETTGGGGFGGYLPSLEAIQSTVDLGVYSFGLSEQSWAHRSFGGGGDDHNPTWTTINNNNTMNSSSAGNNKNSSVEFEMNCCNLVHNYHHNLPVYGHPP